MHPVLSWLPGFMSTQEPFPNGCIMFARWIKNVYNVVV